MNEYMTVSRQIIDCTVPRASEMIWTISIVHLGGGEVREDNASIMEVSEAFDQVNGKLPDHLL